MKALIISDKKSERIRRTGRTYFKNDLLFQDISNIYEEFNVMETVSTIASNCFFYWSCKYPCNYLLWF